MRCKIVDVHSEDAFFDIREKLVGQVVHLTDMRNTEIEGYVMGDAFLYVPIEMSWGPLSNVPFSYVKVEEV